MALDITMEEVNLRKHMSAIYKAQEHFSYGYDDWGKFTAHIVYTQREEIQRLRRLLETNKIDPGPWKDPLG